MRKLLFIFIFITVSFESTAQVNVLWEKRYTSAGYHTDRGADLKLDNSGNVYVAGTVWGNNNYDYYLAKYTNAGSLIWDTLFNGAGNGLDQVTALALDTSGDPVITGYSTGTGGNVNIRTIKCDLNGNFSWSQSYDGTASGFDEGNDIKIDSLGNVYVTGGAADNAGNGSDIVTIKYNSSGTQVWAKTYNGPASDIDEGISLVLDNQLNVYVTGQSKGSGTDLDIAVIKYNSAGTQQFVKRYNYATINQYEVPKKITLDTSGNIYVTGYSYGGLTTESDVITLKYNAAGTLQWAKRYDGSDHNTDQGNDVIVDNSGDVYVAARTFGNNSSAENITIIKYDLNGNIIWTKKYNGPGNAYDEPYAEEIAPSGYLYVTGYSVGNGSNNDYLTLKMDTANANIIWKARFNGASNNSDKAYAMQLDSYENIYVTGASTDTTSGPDISTIKWCQFQVTTNNDTSICFGDSVHLFTTAPGAVSYHWSNGQSLSDSTTATTWANPATTTTYVITSQNTNGCTDFDTITVYVNQLPNSFVTLSGPLQFCTGDSVILTSDTSAAYSWNTGDTTQSITAYNSGIYTITVTDTNSCSFSAQDTVTVFSLPNVNAGLDTNVCSGDSVMLSASGAINYTWNTQSGLSDSTIANPAAFPANSTNFWVKGTDTNGCSNIDTVYVTLKTTPTASFLQSTDTVCLDQSANVAFISTSQNTITRQWNFGDGNTTTTQNPNHNYTSPGLFNILLTVYNNGCSDTASSTVYVIAKCDTSGNDTNGIKENSAVYAVNTYPVPFENKLNVEISLKHPTTLYIYIIDVQGREIYKKYIQAQVKEKHLSINTANFPAGAYFLFLRTDNQVDVKKLMKD